MGSIEVPIDREYPHKALIALIEKNISSKKDILGGRSRICSN
jgi:hypothetical protein